VLDSLATRRRSARGSVRPVTTTGKDRGLSLIGGLRGRPAGVRPLRRGQRAYRHIVMRLLRTHDSLCVALTCASPGIANHRAVPRYNRASLALPPTRSLTRARRSLQGLPGGGSTPLAAGLQAAEHLMKHLQHSGEFPVCVFMTDARGNVALNGSNNRAEAREDAEQQARRLASLEARLLFIDTAPRPREPAQQLARLMHARYLALSASCYTVPAPRHIRGTNSHRCWQHSTLCFL